jgi:preprotein translocase subunit YajC
LPRLFSWSVRMPPGAQLFVILLVLVLFWFVLMRPARNQQRRVQELQQELQIGDEVVLSAGIFGIIRSLEDGRVKLEVSPGTELSVARQAVVRKVEPDTQPIDPDPSAAPEAVEAAEPKDQERD